VIGPGGCFFKHESKLAVAYWSLPALFKSAVSSFASLKVHSRPNHAPIDAQREGLKQLAFFSASLPFCMCSSNTISMSISFSSRRRQGQEGQSGTGRWRKPRGAFSRSEAGYFWSIHNHALPTSQISAHGLGK
jgi:hypothetical protein